MNAPVLLAQLAGSTQAPTTTSKNLKIEKPTNGQAITVHLDGNTRLDFSDIASEKLTFVKIGEKLIVLFDNQSTVTIDPVFDSATGNPLGDVGFQVGDRQMTGDQFAATFPIGTDQSVLPAAGQSGPSAGADFHDAQVGGLGAGSNPLALLGDETSGGLQVGTRDAAVPSIIIGAAVVGEIDDEGLSDGVEGGPGDAAGNATSILNASLNLNFGSLGTSGATLAFLTSQPSLTGLTSGGQEIHLLIANPAGGTPTIIGYVGDDASDPGSHVFEITLGLATATGEYSFTLLRPLDHPDHTTEDTIALVIRFSATNASGTVEPTFTVNVNDDSPDINPQGFDLPLVQGEIQVPHSDLKDPVSSASVRGGTLGILWGADNFNSAPDGGVSETTGHNGDRSLIFADTTVRMMSGEVSLTSSLSSRGESVHFVLEENGTLLVAFTGDGSPTSENTVFTVKLHDTDSGSYVFTQFQELDHVGSSGESGQFNLDLLNLSFNYTATDSDGDSIHRNFAVTIADTNPTVGAPASATVDEDALVGGPATTVTDSGLDDDSDAKTVAGNLNIDWGADDANAAGNVGIPGAPVTGDRAVTFDEEATRASLGTLKHDGTTLTYTFSEGGTLLTAYAGEVAVFAVKLSDYGTGSFVFTLKQSLDHPDTATEDDIHLAFKFIATDADGDTTAVSTFTVTVNDSVPTFGTIEAGTVAESTATTPDNAFITASTGEVSLNISWGADAGNKLGNVTSPSHVDGDRSVQFISSIQTGVIVHTAGSGSPILKSNGVTVQFYRVSDTEIWGLANDNGGALTLSDRKVFHLTLSDANNGSYTFELLDNLDHKGAGQAEVLALSFSVTATDSDGDTTGPVSFIVNIKDDAVVAGEGEATSVREDDLLTGTSPDLLNLQVKGNLNVDWNSDDNNSGSVNRSVAFKSGTPANNVHVTDADDNAIVLTSDGATVQYVIVGNTLIGYTHNDPLFHQVFSVSLNDAGTGSYTFTLLGNLDHPKVQGANTLTITFDYTATDADGDSSSNTFAVTVVDDVVAAHTGDSTNVDEDGLLNGTSPNVFDLVAIGGLNINWGADRSNPTNGAGAHDRSVTFTNSTVVASDAGGTFQLHSDGKEVHFDVVNGVLTGYTGTTPSEGVVFTVSLSDALNGVYSFLLLGNIDHSDGNGQNTLSLTFNYTATDGDGDTSSSTFSVTIKDDVPTAGTASTSDTILNEDDLANGNDSSKDSTSLGGRHLNVNWGADDDTRDAGTGDNYGRTLAFTVTGSGALLTPLDASGNPLALKSGGVPLTYQIVENDDGGQTLVAKAGSQTIFTVTLDAHSTSYTFDLQGPLDHRGVNDQSLPMSFRFTATDADGDPATGSFSLTIVDDAPVPTGVMSAGTVDEGDIVTLRSIGSSPGDGAEDGSYTGGPLDIAGPAFVSGSVGATVSFGADGAAAGGGFSFSANAASVLQGLGLQSKHAALQYVVSGNTLVAYVDVIQSGVYNPLVDRTVFTLVLDAVTGNYEFRLHDQLDHVAPAAGTSDHNSTLVTSLSGGLSAIDFGSIIQATDNDGDYITLDGALKITIVDDTPLAAITLTGAAVVIDETAGSQGNETVSPSVKALFAAIAADAAIDPDMAVAYARNPLPVVLAVSAPGADESSLQHLSLSIVTNGTPSGLSTTEGAPIYLYTVSDTLIVGRIGSETGKVAFAVTIDEIGRVSVAQYTSLHHNDGGNSNDTVDLAGKISAVVSVTDFDGDTVTRYVDIGTQIQFRDDGPIANVGVNAPAVLDDDIFNGNPQGAGDVTDTKTVSGGAGALFTTGADGFQSVTLGAVTEFKAIYIDGNGASHQDSVSWSDPVIVGGSTTWTATGEHGQTVATLTINADGSYTFATNAPLVHHVSATVEENLELTFNFTVKDGDGDTSSGSLIVEVNDDTPTADWVGANPVTETTDSTGAFIASTSHGFFKFNPGADGGKITAINYRENHDGVVRAMDSDAPGGSPFDIAFPLLKSGNVNVVIKAAVIDDHAFDGQGSITLTAVKEGDESEVFVLVVNQTTGEYTFTLKAPLDHPDKNESGASDGLTMVFDFQVTDGDGDQTAASNQGIMQITIRDDAPSIDVPLTPVNLLTNGDFTGGTFAHSEYWGQWATEDTGWKISGTVPGQTGVQLERIESGYLNVFTSNGHPMVDLAATPGNIAISQTINGLATDQSYTLSFEIGASDPSSAGLNVYWNGDLVGTYHPGSTMVVHTLNLTALAGANTVTFEEIGSPDNTGTYLANVSLTPTSADPLPVFHANIGEDGVSVVELINGVDFNFGADGPGAVTFDTEHATISTPTGTMLGMPTLSYDPATGKLTVDPGWGFNGLSEGEIATLSVPFTITDSDGDTKTGIYQFTIIGSNDAVTTSPGFPDEGTITEYAENDPRSGSATDRTYFDDPSGNAGYNGGGFWIYDDQGDTHAITVTPPPGAIGYLTASIGEETANDGAGFVNWQYHVTDAQLNFLSAGETIEQVFRITVSDGHGSSTYRDIKVTLVGAEDAPQITVGEDDSAAAILVEDNSTLTASGTLTVTDVDHLDTVYATVLSVTAGGSNIEHLFTNDFLKGLLTVSPDPVLDADGPRTAKLTWTFDSQDQAFDFLPKGWESVLNYTIQVSDGHGGFDIQVVQIKLQGTNDVPVILGTTVGSVAEAGDFPLVNEAGLGGPLQIAAAHATDPIVAGALTTLDSLLQLPAPGDVVVSQQDVQAALATINSAVGTAVGVTVLWEHLNSLYATHGPDDVNLNAAFFFLGLEYADNLKNGSGLPLVDVIGKYVADGNANNVPDRLQSLHDNLLGNLTADALTQRYGAVGTPLHDAMEQLVKDVDPELLDRPYASGNESANDVAGAHAWDMAHGYATHVSGTLTATDADAVSTLTWSSGTQNGTYGTFTLDAAGHWTYTLDNDRAETQALKQGAAETETFTVTVTDDNNATATTQVVITVNGTNDAPMITSSVSTAPISAQLHNVHQADAGQDFEPAANLDGLIGAQLGIPTGASPDTAAGMKAIVTAVQGALGAGATFADAIAQVWDFLDDNYQYYNTPVNHASVLLGLVYAEYLQDGGQPLLDTIAKFEPDANGDTIVDRSQSLHDNLLGALDLPSIDDKFSSVPALRDYLLHQIEDAGLAGRPYYGGYQSDNPAAAHAWDEDHGLLPVASGQLTATDVDADHTLTWSIDGSATSAYGTISIDQTGAWRFTAADNVATQALAAGEESPVQTFVVKVVDEFGAFDTISVSVVLTGTNDAPVITHVNQTVINAGFEADTSYNQSGPEGQYTNGSPLGWMVSGPSQGGWFDPGPNGAGGSTGVLQMPVENGNNVLWLNDGQTATQTLGNANTGIYQLSVEVGDRADVNLTGMPSFAVRLFAGTILIAEKIVESTTSDSYSWTLIKLEGLVDINAAGQPLRIELANLEMPGSAGDFPQLVQINFDNVNLSYIPSRVLDPITEDDVDNSGQTVASILGGSVTDVDHDALSGIAVTHTASGNGTWQYSIDGGANWIDIGARSVTSALLLSSTDLIRFEPNGAQGTTASFDYVAWDQTSGILHGTADVTNRGGTSAYSQDIGHAAISVADVNDRPVIDAIEPVSINEQAGQTGSSAEIGTTGTVHFSDVDLTDTHAVSGHLSSLNVSTGVTVPVGFGGLITGAFEAHRDADTTGTGNGEIGWTFALTDKDIDFLGAGDTVTLEYTITVTDSSNTGNASGTRTVQITLHGANDAPVITSPDIATEAENTAASHVVYTITATDVDGDAITYSISGTDSDKFVVDENGNIKFKTSPDFEAPTDADHDNVYDIVVHAHDGHVDVSKNVSISVTDVVENLPPAVRDDHIITNFASGTTISIPLAGLLWNEHDPDGGVVSFVSGSLSSNASLDSSGTNVLFKVMGASGTQTSFTYEVKDEAGNTTHETAYVTRYDDPQGASAGTLGTHIQSGNYDDFLINRSGGGAISQNGGDGNDVIVAASNAGGNTIHGGAGNDLLIGGQGGSFLNLFGDEGDDVIYGGSNTANKLDGGAGNDRLYTGTGGSSKLIGGAGDDFLYVKPGATNVTLTGDGEDNSGGGKDHFVFETNSSGTLVTITDFETGKDSIDLLISAFTGLSGTGAVDAADFVKGGAGDNIGSAHFLYEQSSGKLYYDSDGGWGGNRTLIATFENQVALQASDIHKI